MKATLLGEEQPVGGQFPVGRQLRLAGGSSGLQTPSLLPGGCGFHLAGPADVHGARSLQHQGVVAVLKQRPAGGPVDEVVRRVHDVARAVKGR